MAITIGLVKKFFDEHGAVKVGNSWDMADQIGISRDDLIRAISIMRDPEWVATVGWTIPYVKKGLATKTYSVQYTAGGAPLLQEGYMIKTREVLTHMSRDLAQIELAAKHGKGRIKRKAQYMATGMRAALDLVELVESE